MYGSYTVSYTRAMFSQYSFTFWSNMYVFVQMVKVFLHVLNRDIDSKLFMSSVEDVKFYNKVIGAKYLLCGDVWGAADEIKLVSESPGDEL